jgi:class 3 adenylate cyclase
MSGIYQKSRITLLMSLLAVIAVSYTAFRGIASVTHWEPAAYHDNESFLNLTRTGMKWDVRYGGDRLCGQIACRDYSRETLVNYKKTLPNRTFGEESLARDQLLFYQIQVTVPDFMIGPPLGLHFHHLFSNQFEYYVDGELIRKGNGIYPGYLPIPVEAVQPGKVVELTFKIDTSGVSEPGFDLRANLLIGPVALLSQITQEKVVKDRELVLWLSIPRLLIAFLFGLGTMLFAYSRDYIFYVVYTVVSALKVPVFYGSTSLFGLKSGLSHNDLYNLLDLASTTLMFMFIYRFYRQERQQIMRSYLAGAAAAGLIMVLSQVFAASQTAVFTGVWLNNIYKAACLIYFTGVSAALYKYLRYTGRSPARMYIAGTMAVCFGMSLIVLPLAVAFSYQFWIHILLFELIVSCVFAACVSTDMGKVRAERDVIRQKMGIHVDEGLVQELISSEEFIARNVGEAAILFIDIRGFTEMSESSTAQDVFDLLNVFHNQIIDCVYEHHGVIDKFMGDSLMAVWGVRHYDKNGALNATSAAIAMSQRLAELNARREAEQLRPINYGISIHVGPVVAGHIGNSRRADFSVIGSAVNIASRLEGLTGRLGRKILISESVFNLVRSHAIVADLGHHKIRGITNMFQVFALVGVTAGRNEVSLVADPRYAQESIKPWPHMIDEKQEFQNVS